MRRPTLLVLAGLAVAGLAGCSGTQVPRLPVPIPTSVSPAPTRSLPPVTHKWSLAEVSCPTMTNAAAERLGFSGPGTQTARRGYAESSWTIECRWGPDDGSVPAMTVKLSVSKVQAASDAGWQLESSHLYRAEQLTGVGEEAFVAMARSGRGVEVRVRTGNAYTVAHLIPADEDSPAPGEPVDDAELRAAAAAIGADTIDELVPA